MSTFPNDIKLYVITEGNVYGYGYGYDHDHFIA